MTASKQDSRYYWLLLQRQPAPCREGMCSHTVWKLWRRQSAYLGSLFMQKYAPMGPSVHAAEQWNIMW